MGIIKLLERAFLGKEAFKVNEEVREEVKEMKREQKRKERRGGILAAHNENMAISAKTEKIQKGTWKLVREIERKYPRIFVSEVIEE